MEDLAEPCNEMILRCSFEGHERKCSDLFYAQVGHFYLAFIVMRHTEK